MNRNAGMRSKKVGDNVRKLRVMIGPGIWFGFYSKQDGQTLEDVKIEYYMMLCIFNVTF